MKKFLPLLIALVLCACQSTPGADLADSATPIATSVPTLTETPSPTDPPPTPTATSAMATSTTDAAATDAASPDAAPVFQVCVPLEDETMDSLPLILVNPLVIPPFGKDDGHHGVDFAYYRRGERESIQGIEIYAILQGRTVVTLEDTAPYGYAIMIETPLADLPEPVRASLLEGYLPIPEKVVNQGVCPDISPAANTGEMSVYHLYAHMEARPGFAPGDTIACGANLGTVGNTGYSSNPHLHLETRLGPSGADFSSMAFYETTYSEEQRANYCLWRMSGHYQLFDPFILLNAID